jgi:glycosyltransferase involved in cell wall biosynthesis
MNTDVLDRDRAQRSRGTALSKAPLKVAYIMSRFPKITETFILYEILAVQRQGVQVEVYPLWRERTSVVHPDAVPLVERAHFQPFVSLRIICAHLYFLLRKPRIYFSTLWTLLRSNWGSLRYFFGALAIFPKVVYFAYRMSVHGVRHVHAHFASHPAAAGYIIQRLAGIPYSFTAHGSDLHRDRHMLREKVAHAAFVVPISNYNKEIIVAECGEQFRDKLRVVHCGVDTQVFQPTIEQTRQRQRRGLFSILCIGTLHEVKGQTYLIDACRRLQSRGIDFACHFVGDGVDLPALTKQADSAGLRDRVIFHGRRTREEIVELLEASDVLVAPSVPTKSGRREGIPVVLMEAMGSGLPVIASAISGIPELVEHERTGLLVPPRDARTVADALFRMHADPALRKRLGQAGRDKVIREFDLYKNATQLARGFRAEVATCA